MALIFGDDRVAAAIPAEGLAERNVEIERKIPFGGFISRQPFRNGLFVKTRLEVVGRGIGRVARSGNVIFFDLFDIDRKHLVAIC